MKKFATKIKIILITIKTVITYILWFLVSFIFTLICIPLALLPASLRYENRFYFFITTIWTKLLVIFSFVSVKIEGKQNLPKYPNSPAIFVMNHVSALDIPLVEIIVKSYPHIWLSKDSYSKIPLFSILLKRMHILVDKQDSRKALKSLVNTVKLANQKRSHILLFPEGTRHSDGKIHEFLPGFAYLAQKTNRPVIPIAIIGMNKIFTKDSFLIKPSSSKVRLVIGRPFVYLNQESSSEFSKRVKDWFELTLQS